ncbi:MAG: PTS glucose transporter subunit IIA [Oscillospiraceae bacterium]|nr:PTS glucose transporter subunit IIA [Oscillospiraceae bacterium]
MFDFLFKSKDKEILATQSGKAVSLSEVPDEAFSQKLLGDGIAIVPDIGDIFSPADGVIANVFETLHAYAIRLEDGIGILIHVGIDTVELKGEGFETFVKKDQKVKAGELIGRANLEFIQDKGFSIYTPIVITNSNKLKSISYNLGDVKAGQSVVMTYKA